MSSIDKLQRRHHVVPRFHLRRFADERNRLARVVLPGDKRHLISVNDATVEKDFYLAEHLDGRQHDDIEKMLAGFEDKAAVAISDLVDGTMWPITDEGRRAIATWAAFQITRSPLQRQIDTELANLMVKLPIAAGGKADIRALLRQRANQEPLDHDVERVWDELSDFDTYQVRPDNNSHILTMLHLVPYLMPLLMDRGWIVFNFERKSLATSDNPIVFIKDEDHHPLRGVGPANASAIQVPLDRRALLLMGSTQTKDDRLPGTTAVARESNRRTAAHAHKALFHHPADDPLEGISLPSVREEITNFRDQIRKAVPPAEASR